VVNDSNFLTIGFLGYGAYTCPMRPPAFDRSRLTTGHVGVALRLFLQKRLPTDEDQTSPSLPFIVTTASKLIYFLSLKLYISHHAICNFFFNFFNIVD
jgi:hypothetical protein